MLSYVLLLYYIPFPSTLLYFILFYSILFYSVLSLLDCTLSWQIIVEPIIIQHLLILYDVSTHCTVLSLLIVLYMTCYTLM